MQVGRYKGGRLKEKNFTSSIVWHVDCHVHTEYSADGMVPLTKIVDLCRSRGLNGIAVTDHNTIDGALKLQELAKNDLKVIVGEEIKTIDGEVTGLFLRQHISSGKTVEETVQLIKQQDGLVCIPHPFCRFRRSKLKFEAMLRIIDQVDIVEIFNSRTLMSKDNDLAKQFALDNKKGMVAGSDAHLGYEYGQSYTKIRSFADAREFMINLRSSEIVSQRSPLWVHFVTKAKRLVTSGR